MKLRNSPPILWKTRLFLMAWNRYTTKITLILPNMSSRYNHTCLPTAILNHQIIIHMYQHYQLGSGYHLDSSLCSQKLPPCSELEQAAIDVDRKKLKAQHLVVTKRVFGQILSAQSSCQQEMERVEDIRHRLSGCIEVRIYLDGLIPGQCQTKFSSSFH